MKTRWIAYLPFILWTGCGTPPAHESPAGAGPVEAAAAAETDILPRPFTAEQIRDEWVVGFNLTLVRETPEGKSTERWTVVSADEEGLEIEYAALDPGGNAVGDPTRGRSTWIGLRDHATFAAASGKREEVSRETPLGELEGWLYTVHDEDEGTVSEFFFARDYPGAPVQMRTMRGEELVMQLTQIERNRPE